MAVRALQDPHHAGLGGGFGGGEGGSSRDSALMSPCCRVTVTLRCSRLATVVEAVSADLYGRFSAYSFGSREGRGETFNDVQPWSLRPGFIGAWERVLLSILLTAWSRLAESSHTRESRCETCHLLPTGWGSHLRRHRARSRSAPTGASRAQRLGADMFAFFFGSWLRIWTSN